MSFSLLLFRSAFAQAAPLPVRSVGFIALVLYPPGCAQEGSLFKGSPTWRYRVLKTALRLRPRRALSSVSGQRRTLSTKRRRKKTFTIFELFLLTNHIPVSRGFDGCNPMSPGGATATRLAILSPLRGSCPSTPNPRLAPWATFWRCSAANSLDSAPPKRCARAAASTVQGPWPSAEQRNRRTSFSPLVELCSRREAARHFQDGLGIRRPPFSPTWFAAC